MTWRTVIWLSVDVCMQEGRFVDTRRAQLETAAADYPPLTCHTGGQAGQGMKQ